MKLNSKSAIKCSSMLRLKYTLQITRGLTNKFSICARSVISSQSWPRPEQCTDTVLLVPTNVILHTNRKWTSD